MHGGRETLGSPSFMPARYDQFLPHLNDSTPYSPGQWFAGGPSPRPLLLAARQTPAHMTLRSLAHTWLFPEQVSLNDASTNTAFASWLTFLCTNQATATTSAVALLVMALELKMATATPSAVADHTVVATLSS
eukprot:1161948-Pelagomonas_calceolata.AAC.3